MGLGLGLGLGVALGLGSGFEPGQLHLLRLRPGSAGGLPSLLEEVAHLLLRVRARVRVRVRLG